MTDAIHAHDPVATGSAADALHDLKHAAEAVGGINKLRDLVADPAHAANPEVTALAEKVGGLDRLKDLVNAVAGLNR